MADTPLPVPLDAGLHTRENSRDTPAGALVYARNAEYRGLSRGLARRRGRADANATVLTATPGRGITQLKPPGGATDKILTVGAGTLFSAASSATDTDLTYTSRDANGTDAGPTTFAYYNTRVYWSSGSGTPRAYDGTTARQMGLAAGGDLLQVNAVAGTGITVARAYHFAWRYWNNTDKVASDLANAGGKLLYASYSTAGTIQGFALTGMPPAAPSGSHATHIQVFMSEDETNPSTFYLMAQLPIGTGPTYFPSSNTDTAGAVFNFPKRAYDGVVSLTPRVFLSTAYAVCANSDAANHEGRFLFSYSPNESRSDWQLSVTYMYFDNSSGTATPGTIQYSTNGGGAWTTLATLADTSAVNTTTTTATLSGAIAVNSIIVRTVMTRGSSTASPGLDQILGIDDIRLTAGGSGSVRTTLFTVPTATEDFVNSGNLGHYQQPPARIFPTVFEGHLLGVSTTSGLYLAYSRTDEPEHWSTDPTKAAFAYLLPFKEKEADTLVGAEKCKGNLVVMATDSIWRTNHLPVLSDPEGSQADLFAEARSTVIQRVTDTVGCVGVRAYCRLQLSDDQDLIFFWSRSGPMLTDGFKVWRAADHVDWSWMNDALTATVAANWTSERRILVALRSEDASLNDVVYCFHYDPAHLLEGPFGPRLKVTGPWDAAFADMAEVALTTGEKVMLATSNTTSGGEAGQVYRLDSGTNDADTAAAPTFHFVTKRLGVAGQTTTFRQGVFNVQETGTRAFTIGSSTVTPDIPIDKDPLNIEAAGQSLEVDWLDDTVTFRAVMEDEEVVTSIMPAETVSFTTTDRIVNRLTVLAAVGGLTKD